MDRRSENPKPGCLKINLGLEETSRDRQERFQRIIDAAKCRELHLETKIRVGKLMNSAFLQIHQHCRFHTPSKQIYNIFKYMTFPSPGA